MMSFVRAHSPEQREVRRTTILDTARAMLDEMPVAEITLNGLSRKSCMAKSNVLRYFESREAILLELCAEALSEWVIDLESKLSDAVSPTDPAPTRAERIVAVITTSLAERPVLCDLLSAQAGVLEHNISTGSVLGY
jgi:AcrR family transcriptional regulator